MGAVEFVADKGTKRRFAQEGAFAGRVRDKAEELGVITRAVPCGDSIAFSPPLGSTLAAIDRLALVGVVCRITGLFRAAGRAALRHFRSGDWSTASPK
jgi:adenosylmethionine-8-amino-7-oxononanoate aminotransferase